MQFVGCNTCDQMDMHGVNTTNFMSNTLHAICAAENVISYASPSNRKPHTMFTSSPTTTEPQQDLRPCITYRPYPSLQVPQQHLNKTYDHASLTDPTEIVACVAITSLFRVSTMFLLLLVGNYKRQMFVPSSEKSVTQ